MNIHLQAANGVGVRGRDAAVVPARQCGVENCLDEFEQVLSADLAAADEPNVHLVGFATMESVNKVAAVDDAGDQQQPVLGGGRHGAEGARDGGGRLRAEDVVRAGVAGVAAV